MKRCPICGAKIEDGLETCPYCGEVIGNAKTGITWTDLTGRKDREEPKSENSARQVYYYDPETPSEPKAPKKKSKAGLISVALIVVFIAAIAIYVATGGNKSFEDDPVIVDDAYNQAVDFFNAVYDDAVVLEDTGYAVADAWYEALDNGGSDDEAKEAVGEILAQHKEDLDAVTLNQANISYLFAQALSVAQDSGQSKLADAIEEMYNEYFDFLEAVMNTDRSYDEYIDDLNDADNELYDAMQTLYDILSE